MGTPRLPGAPQSCILSLQFTRLLVSPSPWGYRVRRRVGVNGVEGVRGHSRPKQTRVGSRDSLKPPLLPLLPSPVEGRGCQGRASRALGNSPRPPPLPLPGGEAPPRIGAPSPPPPPSGSCCSLRLRSGSTSFLRREKARVVCCWGVRGRRFEITWPSGLGLREQERELGRMGWGRREPTAEAEVLTSPQPHSHTRGFQEGSPIRCFSSSVQPPTRWCPLSIPYGVARMPQAKGLALGLPREQDCFPAHKKLPVGG